MKGWSIAEAVPGAEETLTAIYPFWTLTTNVYNSD
jgi:hypothetical protein